MPYENFKILCKSFIMLAMIVELLGYQEEKNFPEGPTGEWVSWKALLMV